MQNFDSHSLSTSQKLLSIRHEYATDIPKKVQCLRSIFSHYDEINCSLVFASSLCIVQGKRFRQSHLFHHELSLDFCFHNKHDDTDNIIFILK